MIRVIYNFASPEQTKTRKGSKFGNVLQSMLENLQEQPINYKWHRKNLFKLLLQLYVTDTLNFKKQIF